MASFWVNVTTVGKPIIRRKYLIVITGLDDAVLDWSWLDSVDKINDNTSSWDDWVAEAADLTVLASLLPLSNHATQHSSAADWSFTQSSHATLSSVKMWHSTFVLLHKLMQSRNQEFIWGWGVFPPLLFPSPSFRFPFPFPSPRS